MTPGTTARAASAAAFIFAFVLDQLPNRKEDDQYDNRTDNKIAQIFHTSPFRRFTYAAAVTADEESSCAFGFGRNRRN